MATKNNQKSTKSKAATKTKKAPAKKAAAPAVKKVKAAPVPQGPRHPRGRLQAAHGTKEALAKSLAASLAKGSEDTDLVAARLKTASNAQLLRLQKVTDAVKQKYGSRQGLITAIGDAQKKGKDKDYLAKLDTYSLPQLLDLAKSVERRARS